MKKFAVIVAMMMTPYTAYGAKTFRAEPLVEPATPKASIQTIIRIDYELEGLRSLRPAQSTTDRLELVETVIRNRFPERLVDFQSIANPLRDKWTAILLNIPY